MTEQATTQKSLSKNTIWYLLYNVLNIIFPLLTSIYVARVLLPDTIGQVYDAQNIASYFSVLAFLGIPTYGLREIAKTRGNKEERNRLFTELYIINLISTIIFSIAYVSVVFIVPEFRNNLALYLVAGIIIVINAFNINWLYEGLEEFKFESIRNLICKALSFVILVLFVKNDSNSLIFASILAIATGLNYLVNMLVHSKHAKFTFKNLNLKRHMKPILFLVAVNLAIEIYTLVDTTMIARICGEVNKDQVAFYVNGNKIFKVFLQVVNTFTIVVVPRLTEYFQDKKQIDFNNLLSKTLRILIMIAIPLVVGIFFLGDLVIQILYSSDKSSYETSGAVLKILSLSLIFSPIGYLLGSRVCLIAGKEKKMLLSVAVGAVLNVGLNFLLINLFQYNNSIVEFLNSHFTHESHVGFGEFGAAIASVISEIVVMIVYIAQGKKYFKLNGLFDDILKPILATNIMLCFLTVLNLINFNFTNIVLANQIIELVTKFIVGLLTYFISLFALQQKDVVYTLNKLKIRSHSN